MSSTSLHFLQYLSTRRWTLFSICSVQDEKVKKDRSDEKHPFHKRVLLMERARKSQTKQRQNEARFITRVGKNCTKEQVKCNVMTLKVILKIHGKIPFYPTQYLPQVMFDPYTRLELRSD